MVYFLSKTVHFNETRLQGYKTFSCSTQLSMKFTMLIDVKMSCVFSKNSFILMRPGPENKERFSCSNQLRMEFIILINVKMSCVFSKNLFILMRPGSEDIKKNFMLNKT